MKKYLKEYIEYLEVRTKNNKKATDKEIQSIITKINFFQHERLIHLIVTVTVIFLVIIFMVLGMLSYIFLIPFGILIVFLIFYILHYFYLENGVQYLYKLYDEIIKKI